MGLWKQKHTSVFLDKIRISLDSAKTHTTDKKEKINMTYFLLYDIKPVVFQTHSLSISIMYYKQVLTFSGIPHCIQFTLVSWLASLLRMPFMLMAVKTQ